MSTGILATNTLRCHSCSHALVQSDVVMEFVGMFHPRRITQAVEIHADERRHRCGSCGWVNIFRPRTRHAEVVIK